MPSEFSGWRIFITLAKRKKEKKAEKKRILTHKMYFFKKKYSPLS
jgi:hypothetical protein